MKKFEANCLEKVYELATAEFNCSITELEIEVIQQPSKGFLGFGKKNAIIQACFKDNCRTYVQETKTFRNKDVKIQEVSERIEYSNQKEERNLLQKENLDFICVHGSLNKKEQVENMALVNKKSLIIATTSYFGEGIDFPHLNTIMFATPISYYGRLVQYLGRIGRGNQECLAIDFLDSKNAMLNSAYKKRLEGYKQMHYK